MNHNPSPFYSSNGMNKDQMNLISDSDHASIENKINQITAAMDLDLESMYRKLDESLLYINDPNATRLIEDVRDEIYRNLR